MKQHILAISIGDPGGIGPEIVVKAFRDSDLLQRCTPVVFGPAGLLRAWVANVADSIPLHDVASPSELLPGAFNAVAVSPEWKNCPNGAASAAGGSASLEAIAEAVRWCSEGTAVALVTAPISKESIGMAGSAYRGHTEYIRDLTQSSDVLMVLASKTMRVGLATVHIPLRQVATDLTSERLESIIRQAHAALIQDFGIAQPRLALLGLNPHAGDGGYLGSEESDILLPVRDTLRGEGISVDGPFPADAFFSAYGASDYDMVIAMYHDQGLIPLKMSAAGRAVNISCGLPIVRTSPDHGTAFDIAGKDMADPGSFIQAVEMALDIAERRAHYTKEAKHD